MGVVDGGRRGGEGGGSFAQGLQAAGRAGIMGGDQCGVTGVRKH